MTSSDQAYGSDDDREDHIEDEDSQEEYGAGTSPHADGDDGEDGEEETGLEQEGNSDEEDKAKTKKPKKQAQTESKTKPKPKTKTMTMTGSTSKDKPTSTYKTSSKGKASQASKQVEKKETRKIEIKPFNNKKPKKRIESEDEQEEADDKDVASDRGQEDEAGELSDKSSDEEQIVHKKPGKKTFAIKDSSAIKGKSQPKKRPTKKKSKESDQAGDDEEEAVLSDEADPEEDAQDATDIENPSEIAPEDDDTAKNDLPSKAAQKTKTPLVKPAKPKDSDQSVSKPTKSLAKRIYLPPSSASSDAAEKKPPTMPTAKGKKFTPLPKSSNTAASLSSPIVGSATTKADKKVTTKTTVKKAEKGKDEDSTLDAKPNKKTVGTKEDKEKIKEKKVTTVKPKEKGKEQTKNISKGGRKIAQTTDDEGDEPETEMQSSSTASESDDAQEALDGTPKAAVEASVRIGSNGSSKRSREEEVAERPSNKGANLKTKNGKSKTEKAKEVVGSDNSAKTSPIVKEGKKTENGSDSDVDMIDKDIEAEDDNAVTPATSVKRSETLSTGSENTKAKATASKSSKKDNKLAASSDDLTEPDTDTVMESENENENENEEPLKYKHTSKQDASVLLTEGVYPTPRTPPKRKAESPATPCPAPKKSPSTKISNELRAMIIASMIHPDYLKTVPFATLQTAEFPVQKLQRHWKQVLALELEAHFKGETPKKGKLSIDKSIRLKMWEMVCRSYEKLNWKEIEAKAEDDIDSTKLKRHFREVMIKEGKRYIENCRG
nr:uncharacterized protein I303_05032 [Kwoniella dejecticola CBS 10117]OBR84175.1 hypothetical protein I303_05032 [Kwoniella dejecticola CBS 10117]